VVIRSCKSKDRQHNGYKIPKWLSEAVNQRRQHNGYKIPKWLSEAVNQRTDNTMDNRKRTNTDLQNTKQKIEHNETN
jgi:hypothetical protein